MILSKITQATQFLPSLNLTLENDRFEDFFRSAQEWLVSHIIGEGLEATLESEVGMTDTDSHEDLRRLCQRIIARKGLLAAIPEMDLQLTEAGFAVQQNEQFTPASAQRVDRLVAKLPGKIASDTDSLVRYLMKNSGTNQSAYSGWRGTDQFKYLTSAFLPLYEYFNRFAVPVAESYDEYYDTMPILEEGMRIVADYYVSNAEIDRLLEMYRDNDLLDIHQQAVNRLSIVAAAARNKDINRARSAAIRAREIMLSAPDSFPAFKASAAYTAPSVNLNGGKMVNML